MVTRPACGDASSQQEQCRVDDPFPISPPFQQYRATYFGESACSILNQAAFSVDAPDSSACKLWRDMWRDSGDPI